MMPAFAVLIAVAGGEKKYSSVKPFSNSTGQSPVSCLECMVL
jgi:hypothetical protein